MLVCPEEERALVREGRREFYDLGVTVAEINRRGGYPLHSGSPNMLGAGFWSFSYRVND